MWTRRRGPTPAALTAATLNRYGPDTKAAVVLVGANRLLRDVTAAVARVCRALAELEIAPELRLAVWAGLVLEAFRAQPALVAAAIQARAIQRALTTSWGEHVAAQPDGSCPLRVRRAAGSVTPPATPTARSSQPIST